MVCGNFRAQNIWSVVVCGIQANPYLVMLMALSTAQWCNFKKHVYVYMLAGTNTGMTIDGRSGNGHGFKSYKHNIPP